jgi:argininosuccinate lyase
MKGVLSTLKINKAVMAARAGANFTQATQLAEIIVKEKDLAFRTAHRIVGRLVKNCMDQGKSPAEVTSAMVDDASLAITGRSLRMKDETVRKAMDPRYFIANRKILGGPGKKQVIRMLRQHGVAISKNLGWLKAQEAKIENARRVVSSTVKRLTRER